MTTFDLTKPVKNNLRGDDTAKFRMANDAARDALITGDLIKLGHIIYHEADGKHYKLKTYPTFGNLTGVVWEDLGGSTPINNTLTSTSTAEALSANQGKTLKDLIDGLQAILNADDVDLDTAQERIDFIKNLASELDGLQISDIENLQTTLNNKVEIVSGKGLSTNDFTDELKDRLLDLNAMPNPRYRSITPPNVTPNLSGQLLTIKGSFFPPDVGMQTSDVTKAEVTNITFIDDNNVVISVDVSDIDLSGGDEILDLLVTTSEGVTVFENRLLISEGLVFVPTFENYSSVIDMDVSEGDVVTPTIFNSNSSSAIMEKTFPHDKSWSFRFNARDTPLQSYVGGNNYSTPSMIFKKVSDDTSAFEINYYSSSANVNNGAFKCKVVDSNFGTISFDDIKNGVENINNIFSFELKYDHINGLFKTYKNGVLSKSFTISEWTMYESCYIMFTNDIYEYWDLKYVEQL